MSHTQLDGDQSLGFIELLTSRRTKPRSKQAKEDTSCTCTPADGCRQGCINRATYTECDPARCPAGAACTNQRLQRSGAVGVACSLRHMPGKGWGVVADQVVHQGTLVVEYVGEVVSTAEGARRAAEYANSSRHTYIMGLRCVHTRVDAYRLIKPVAVRTR